MKRHRRNKVGNSNNDGEQSALSKLEVKVIAQTMSLLYSLLIQ